GASSRSAAIGRTIRPARWHGHIPQSAKKSEPAKVKKKEFLIDEKGDHHEGTSRALRRPSWARNADVLSVWQARGRNRRNRRSLVWNKLLLLQDQRQRRQFVHFAF